MSEIRTYTVTATHPLLSEPLVMDLIATSPARAITRARMAAFHMYKHEWPLSKEATFEAVDIGDVAAIHERDLKEEQA